MSGTLSVLRSPPPSLEVSTTFSSNQEARSSTSELPPVPPSHTFLMSSAPYVLLLIFLIPFSSTQTGLVYAVEFSARSGRDLINVAKKRTNIIPIVEDARFPHKYRMLVGMVDVLFADVAQPDQARIFELNARNFLKVMM